jgi:flagellar motility protein MotE (MotC chaperone)
LRELSRSRSETEQRLRAAEKELVSMREESILKTNQFQNSEAQLKNKLDELMDSLAKMKSIY